MRWAVVCVLLGGCWSAELIDGQFTREEWDYIQTFRRDAIEPPPCDVRCRELAGFGRVLFFEPGLSGPITVPKDSFNHGVGELGETGKVACASCHEPAAWFIDRRSRPPGSSLGTGWTGRNTPTVVDAIYQGSFALDGKYETIAGVLELATASPAALNTSKQRVAEAVAKLHRAEYDALFDPDLPPCPNDVCPELDAAVFAGIALAIGTYESRLVSGLAPFDRYAAGAYDELSESAKRGLGVFIGRGLCSECHTGAMFSDGLFHNTGLAQRGEHAAAIDHGRNDVTGDGADDGAFRTPILRGVSETAPYMHAGQLADLGEVIDHYRWGGEAGGYAGVKDARIVALEIDDQDALDLEAFLGALTGPPADPTGMTP